MKKPILEHRWADKYPEVGKIPVSVEPNVSKDYFEKERELIFRRSWLCVGRVNQIPAAGDYFVRDVKVLKTSVLIAHGHDGHIAGFHNVCQHRGNKLKVEGKGNVSTLVCGFHGWVYDLKGLLAHVPDEDQFSGFDKCEYGLARIAVDIWEGFIFINLETEPKETLMTSMGNLHQQYGDFPFNEMEVVSFYSATVNANWKVFMDITQESYHVPFLHRKIVPDSNVDGDNPFCHLPSIRIHEFHRSSSIYANPDHKLSPVEKIAYKPGSTVLGGTDFGQSLPKGVNPDKVENWAFDSNIIFPNLILHVSNGWFITHSYWPISVNCTYWENKLYMKPAETAGQKMSQEFSKVIARDLARGDLSTLETVQKGLESGALKSMPLSDQEINLRHHYSVVNDLVQRRQKEI